jgi:hypothetical protein
MLTLYASGTLRKTISSKTSTEASILISSLFSYNKVKKGENVNQKRDNLADSKC